MGDPNEAEIRWAARTKLGNKDGGEGVEWIGIGGRRVVVAAAAAVAAVAAVAAAVAAASCPLSGI